MNKLIAALLLVLMGSYTYAQTQAPKPIIFILDASGSMWQKVEGEFKISLAREVLGEMVDELPSDQAIGLVAYGHRKKGDCSDIEEIIPSSNTDHAVFRKALQDLNPLGKTPLARSAKQVLDQLKTQEEAATVILITDGLETCDGDLCETVRDAKAAGIEFVMHIIGFDLKGADTKPLECAAAAGDGLYLDASSQEELSDALTQTSEQSVTEEEPEANLSVKTTRGSELIDCAIRVFLAGSDQLVKGQRSYSSPETNPAKFHVPAGTYDIEAEVVKDQGVLSSTKRNIQVKEGEMTELVFDFSSGSLELLVTGNGELHDAAVKIIPQGESSPAAGGRTYTSANSNPMKKELTPGTYSINLKSVTIKGETFEHTIENVQINGGESLSLSHEFESGKLMVGATYQGDLCDALVRIYQNGKNVAGARTYSSSSSNPRTFILSPGTYEVKVQAVKVKGVAEQTFNITIKKGETAEKNIRF